MATLIFWADGNRRRRCDARCYNAKHQECKCICQGKNHGVGLKQAVDNVLKTTPPEGYEVNREVKFMSEQMNFF